MSQRSTDRRVDRIVAAMAKAVQRGDFPALEASDASVPLGDVAHALIGWIREQVDLRAPDPQNPRETASRAENGDEPREAGWNTGAAFLALIQASPLAIIALDAAGRVTLWNPAAEAIFGWTEEEALGRSLPYIPEDKAEEHRLLRERVLRGESFTNLEVRRRKKDGSAVDISISTAPLCDSDGRVTGIISLNADVTERRRVREELEYREQIYRGLFENMALGVVYQSTDGRILSANPAAERILGLSLDELRSRTSLDPSWNCVREDGSEFPGDQHPSMQALATGRPVYGVVMGVPQSDSRELRWLLLDATPEFRPGETKPYQVFTTFSDITERKRAAEALDRNTRLLKEVQRLARLGHYDLDAETGIWQSSEVLNEIFGIDEAFHKDVEGWLELVHPDDRQEMATYLNDHVLSAHQPFDREYRIVRRSDGQERWVYGRGQVVVDARGSVKRMIGTIQDITERKKLEERVAQSQKLEAVGQLAGGIAHDFNNMLSVILGYAELIKVRHPGEDLLLKDILEIEKAATHSKDVTSQLLAFSRKQIISPRTTDLNELILKAERTLLPLIGENIQLRIFLAEDLAPIRFDPSQIEQILVNLAVNARDAMPEGGVLTIETARVDLREEDCRESSESQPGEYVVLQVSDAGEGMEPEVLAHVFEPFFTTKEPGRGTGLGLATIYGIVKQNGGFVTAESQPGEGAVFRVYIPKILSEPNCAAEVAKGPPPSGGGRVLLVEDDDMVRKMASAMLGRLGYAVIATDSPDEALSICGDLTTSIDLLMTDVVMPGLSGDELRERALALRPDLPVLFMSGYAADARMRRRVLDEGIHFIQKPFGLQELARRVHLAVGRPAGA